MADIFKCVAVIWFIVWRTNIIVFGNSDDNDVNLSNLTACNLPCQNGTFEVMPCSDTHPKLCKECAKTCNIDGYFINGPCGPTHNTDCKLCRAKCGRLDYEYTPCIGSHDRQCKDVDSLVKPSVSKNIIYEDRRQVKQVLSYNLQQDTKTPSLTHVFPLNRGSGLTVRVSIIEASLAPMFRAVNHSESNDNEGFYQDIRITQEYCAYPIPEKYELSLNLHQGITTKAQYYSCNRSKRSTTSRCDGETGYYLHPREACETFNKYGRLPNLNTEGWSILCTKPGKLSDMFGISSELTDMTTMFVDKTLKCAEQRTNCDSCLTKCAHNMQKHVGSHRCNITADDSDNGESPRLQYCFSCCNKQECSKSCEVYHNRDCQQLRCITGNLAEFVLQPVYSHRSSVFACHIEPIPGYKIYDVEYAVLHEGKIVNDRTLKARRLYSKASGHPQRSVDTHTFLKIFFGSEITTLPDLIEGDSLTKLFSAGYYQAKQAELTSSDITSRTLFVRPKSPFSVSSKTWRKENCDTDIISQLVSATGNPPESDPFRPDSFLEVHYVSRGTYRLNNKTQSHLPFIYFEVPKEQSVLRAVYDPTTVRDDNTLKAELIRRDKEWSLHVNGELLKCPGAFNIVVRDGLNPTQTLFDYDVGVSCPNTFALDYTIPTEGLDDYDKTFLVDISDSYRTIKMKIFRPAPSMTKEDFEFFRSNKSYDTPVNYNASREHTMTIFTPLIAVLCVVIFCMALVLFIGFVTETDKLGKKSDSDKVDSQHLFFVVCFVTFRATYSVAITFTILVLLIRHFNKESTNTLTQFPQYAETAGNSQRLDIEQIQLYVRDELQRQNSLANNTKHTCEQKLIQLQSQLEDAKQHMRVDNQEDRLVTQVALQYTKLMILNLTNNVNKFKQEFTAYAKKALDRLTRSIVQTSSAIQSSKWLAGAKVIYEAVKSKRSAQGLDTKPFMEWAGIEQEVDRLVADLSLKDFPLPNLTEFLNVEIPKTNTKQTPIPKASDVVLPRNQWYYQYEKKPPAFGADSSAEKPPKETKLNTNDIISLTSLLAILVAIDLVWFIHRMARTYSTAKMILYGCPVYIACKKLTGDSSHRAESGKSSRIVKCLRFVKDLNLRIMKTEFVPKLVATVTVCCTLYIVLAASDKLLTVKTLASLGYFDALVAPVETSYRLAITRVKMNAHRINKFEFPFYEELVNVRTKRYQLLLEMYAEVQRSNAILHDSEYCMWKKMLKPDEPCNCTMVQVGRLHFDGCELPPVLPQAYHRKDFGLHREQLSHAIVPYVNAAREIIMDTGHLVAIFVAILVLVDILGAVVWIYLKRFNLLRLKPLFEIEQLPIPEAKRT